MNHAGNATVVTLLLLATACAEPPPPPEPLRPVRSMRVETSDPSQSRSFAGVIRAGRETQLSFRVSGRIELLDASVGDRVTRGKLIARLETDDFEIALRRAEAELAQARAAARNAAADLDRVRGMYENGNAAQNELDAALAAAESSDARVVSAEQLREQARRQLEYAKLNAPVDGSIAAVPVEVNENVRAGQEIVTLTSDSRPEVDVAMPEAFITQVRRGDRVGVVVEALGGRTFEAEVTEVGVASTGGSTTFPVTARVAGNTADLRSGMTANVHFRFADGKPASRIYLPAYAVGEDRNGRFVFTVEPTAEEGVAIVRRTAVEVGDLNGEQLEILSGLANGQTVVTAGVRRLNDGQRVRNEEAHGEP